MVKNIVLDTDIGTDSDDIGALSILCNLARQQKIRLLAVTSCSSITEPVRVADMICECYGVSVPMGKSLAPYGDDEAHNVYARKLCDSYKSRLDGQEIPSAVSVLRRALVGGNVTLVAIGPLNNISALLDSQPDEISPLDGVSLLNSCVTELYAMAGSFATSDPEWNVAEDVGAFHKLLREVTCPITFIPFEVGYKVRTATNFLNGEDCPMKAGYLIHNGGAPRESWDPITAYCAAVQCLPTTDWGVVHCDERGVTTFEGGGGNHRVVRADFDVADVTARLESLMIKP